MFYNQEQEGQELVQGSSEPIGEEDEGVTESVLTRRSTVVRLPRMIVGEWRCLDCAHLAYGDSLAPRCPNCMGQRLVATVAALAKGASITRECAGQ